MCHMCYMCDFECHMCYKYSIGCYMRYVCDLNINNEFF